jgi:hypothetical protein
LYGEILHAQTPVLRRRRLLLAQVERIEAYGARRRDDALLVAGWRLAATSTADPGLLVGAAALARYAHDYPRRWLSWRRCRRTPVKHRVLWTRPRS